MKSLNVVHRVSSLSFRALLDSTSLASYTLLFLFPRITTVINWLAVVGAALQLPIASVSVLLRTKDASYFTVVYVFLSLRT